jgi:hypothetical protein
MFIIEKKNILELVLNDINDYIQKNSVNPNEKMSDRFIGANGLCFLVTNAIIRLQSQHIMFIPILQDIQKVNQIEFEELKFYKPFYEKERTDIQTLYDLKLWYKKRIEVVQKTIDYYNEELLTSR